MPFIDSKIVGEVTDIQKESIKTRLGQAVSLLHKTESYLMVGIKDNYDLYFAGKQLDKGAFVSVNLYGQPSSSDCDKMTGEICKIYKEELDIPGENIYITYQGYKDWGWNSHNF